MNLSAIIQKFKIDKSAVFLILALIVFRIMVVILTANNIPPTYEMQNGSWFYNGGDGDSYFQSAQALLGGKFLRGAEPAGLSLIYAPIIFLTGANSVNEIIILMAIIYGIIFNAIATVMVYRLARKFFADPRKALGIAAFFQIYPYLFYIFFSYFAGSSEVIGGFTSSRFLQLNFMHIASDAWSMILALSSLFVLFKITETGKDGMKAGGLLGILGGWAAITRFQNFVILPVYGLILLFQKKFRSLIGCIIGATIFITLQGYANWTISGSIFKSTTFEFTEKAIVLPPLFGFSYPLRLIEYPLRYSPWLLIPLVLGAALIILGAIAIIKKDKPRGLILAAYSAAITIFLLFLWPSYMNPRYFLPVIPVLFIYAYAGLENIFLIIKGRIQST